MTYRAVLFDGGLAFASWAASGSLRPFMRRLLSIRQCYPADQVGVCWDAPRDRTWRRALSPAYKAKRPASPGGLSDALAALRGDLPALDVVQYAASGAEADDVLYTLSRTLPGRTLLVSGDKDMLQAVSPTCDLLRAASAGATWNRPDQLITEADIHTLDVVMGKTHVTGLSARGWTDFLTLAGDPVDGIPGLRGVGPKHALDLLEACPDFVELVLSGAEGQDQARRECAARSAPVAKFVERAIAHLNELHHSRELVRLRLVEVEAVDAEPDPDRARAILEGARLENRA